jgi:Glucodextranase, domain B
VDKLTWLSVRPRLSPAAGKSLGWSYRRALGIALLLAPGVALAQVPALMDFAVYATGTGCGAITMSGSAYVDSFDSSQGSYTQTQQLSQGIVGVSGNINLSGSATINGPIFALNTTAGACKSGTPGITTSGGAKATGGYIQLSAAPAFPPPAPVTPGSQNYNFSSNASLAPGNYGNITVSGGKTLTLSPGTYNLNSVTLSGGSILTVSPAGQVILNVAGNNVSQPLNFSGGAIANPSGIPLQFQVIYGGSQAIVLSGGSASYALVYAPNAAATLSGGSGWYGAIVAKTLNNSGSPIHYDRHLAVPPAITVFNSPPPNTAGWNNGDVTVTFTCTDPILGIASCTAPVTVTAEGTNQVVTGTAVNRAGFSSSLPVTLNIDKTPPMISASSAPQPNAAGWNNSDVTVSFTCSDTGSGMASCTAPVAVTADGRSQIVSGVATDLAGNIAGASVNVNLDKTPPAVAVSSPMNGSTIALSASSISVIGSGNDALSGLTGVTCNGAAAAVSGSSFTCTVSLVEGSNSIAIQAMDAAGNAGASNLMLSYAPAPQVTIAAPANLSVTNISPVTVNGTVSDPTATIRINGIPAPQSAGGFSIPVPLVEGLNVLAVVATSAAGSASTATVQVTLDTTPPHITIDSPANGSTTTDASVTVTGMANDVVVGTVNSQDVQVTVNGMAAQVANRTYAAAAVPLAVGPNTIQAAGVDKAGNGATTSITVTRMLPGSPPQPPIGAPVVTDSISVISGNNQTGVIGSQLPAPLIVALVDSSSQPVPNQMVVFQVIGNNGNVAASGGGVGASAVAVNTDANGQARAFWTLGQRSGAGINTLQVTSPLAFGTANFSATGVTSDASLIVVDSGNGQTGAVGQALPFPFAVAVTDSGHNRVPGVPVTFTVQQGGGNFAGSASQTVITDSNGRALAVLTLGLQNSMVTATFPGNTGAPVAFSATAKTPGDPANTTISGVVLDNSNNPIPGATIRLFQTNQGNNNNVPVQIGTPVQTNAQGSFTIPSAPVGFFKLMADGSTATGPKSFPTLEYDIVTVAGTDNSVGMPIYLPALDTVNSLCVDATHGGVLTLPQYPGFSLTVAAGSATFPGGALQGCITVSAVHGDKVPMAPGFGQQPRFIVTIQPVGTTFNPPAPISIPNVDGLAPKSVTEMYSYDHDLGMFVAIGTGTVSADGSVIASDPGVGVLKAGWHCGGNPNANGTVADCPDCQYCQNDMCVFDPSQDGHRATSGSACCINGHTVPLQAASYSDLIANCPNRVQNTSDYAIDGCSVLGAQLGLPSLNIQNPTQFLLFPVPQLFNQASTDFGANIGSVPLGGPPQTLPCNLHDVCYQTCNNVQSGCDSAFDGNMNAVCSTAYPATCPYSGLSAIACPEYFVERLACFDAASLYYTGVNELGQGAFQGDQQEHCQCCQ